MAFSSVPSQIGPYVVRHVLCTTHAGALLGVEEPGGGRRQTVMLLDPDQPRWPARLRERLPAHPRLCALAQEAPRRIECEDRTYYYVGAESLSGWTVLDEIERDGRIHTVDRAVRLCAEAAEALAHVHASGSAHGHLEPGCLFIQCLADDDEGSIKLLGAGLDVLASPASRAGRYRRPGARPAQTVRARVAADLFALGGVLYHMITGQAPDRKIDRGALRAAGASVQIEAIALRALAPDSRARFSSMTSLRQALLEADPVPPPTLPPGHLWYRGRASRA